MSGNLNVSSLFAQAGQDGDLSAAAQASLTAVDLGTRIQDALGTPGDQFEGSEAFFLTVIVDDTGSIAGAGNERLVIDGVNQILDALQGSKSRKDILVHMVYLYQGSYYPYTPLDTAVRLDGRRYKADAPSTPLFQQSYETLATVLAKGLDYQNQGIPVRTATVIITDGANNSGNRAAKDVAVLVADLIKAENHIVMAMGIDDGQTDFRNVFKSMGIPVRWILTPSNDPHSIRDAFGVMSRTSAAASQSAAAFSKTVSGGFATGSAT